MEWYPLQSLEHSASLKVVTQLFRTSAGLQSIVSIHNDLDESEFDSCCFTTPDLNWVEYRKQIGVFVVPLLEKLKLPPKLERKLLALCEPVTLQLVCWVKRLNKTLVPYCPVGRPTFADILAHARWKFDGRLDVEKSMQVLLILAEERLPAQQQFALACRYFLEREAFLWWAQSDQLPDMWFYKITYLHEVYAHPEDLNSLIDYEREKNSIDDSNFWCQALLLCMTTCNETGFKRCWERWLASTPHALSLAALAPIVDGINDHYSFIKPFYICSSWHSEIFRILWSSLSDLQLRECLKQNANLLRVFLEWPYQRLFLKLICLTWDIIDEDDFCILLLTVFRKTFPRYSQNPELFDYRQLFRDFWTVSPPKYKSCFLENWHGLIYLLETQALHWVECWEDLAFVCKDFSREEKGEFLKWVASFPYSMVRQFPEGVYTAKLREFVDMFLECGVNDSSLSAVKKIRNVMEERGWFDHVSVEAAGVWLRWHDQNSEEEDENVKEREEDEEVKEDEVDEDVKEYEEVEENGDDNEEKEE